MVVRLVPATCPRCTRPSEEWSLDRDARSTTGRAGCPCGEVIEVSWLEPVAHESKPAVSVRRPTRWKENARPDEWRAILRPSGRRLWILAFMFVYLGARSLLVARTLPALLVHVGLLLAMASFVGLVHQRTWSFAFAGGRFRAAARGEQYEVDLEQVLRFTVEKTRERASLVRRLAPFELLVHVHDRAPHRLPLFVDGAAEADFVAERANALLATNGRSTEQGYRGERLRIAVEEPAIAPAITAEEEPQRRAAQVR